MKKIKTLDIFLLFVALASQTYAQHAILFSGGKYYPSRKGSTYLSEHSILQLGYQYSTKEQLSIQASFGGNLLERNTDYSMISESGLSEFERLFLLNKEPSIRYTSLFSELEVGKYWRTEAVIQPFAFTGVSWNYIYHSYSDVPHLSSSSITFDQIDERKHLFAYHLSVGTYLKITDHFKIQLSTDYALFYKNKVGVQQLQLNTYSLQVGIVLGL